MGAGGSRPINNQSKVVLVKGSDEGKTIDFVTASSASEERKDDRDSPDDESIVQPFTSFETVPEPPRGASPVTNPKVVGSTTATVVASDREPRPRDAQMEETGGHTHGESDADWYLQGIDDEIEELGL